MPSWVWIIIGVLILGGLSLLNKETRTAVMLEERIRHLRGHLNFLSANLSEIKTAIEQHGILSESLEENIREIHRAIGTAMGTLAKAEVELEYHKGSKNKMSRLNYLNAAIETVNIVVKAISEDDRAATIILDNIPRHCAVDELVEGFRRKKRNIMQNNSSLKLIEQIAAA